MNRHHWLSAAFFLLILIPIVRFASRTLESDPPSAPSSREAVSSSGTTAGESGDFVAKTLLGVPPVSAAADRPTADDALAALPRAEQESLRQAFHEVRHAVAPLTPAEAALPQNHGVRYFAANPGQQITARFLDGAVRVESGRGGAWAGTLSLEGGTRPAPVANGSRVEFRHDHGITEWYENRAEGIEQGFTLAGRPGGSGPDGIRVGVTLDGLEARPAGSEEAAVEFVETQNGEAVLRYEKLKVWDATGRVLESRFEVEESGVGLLVADAGAVYPVTIDPLIVSQEAKLETTDEEAGDGSGTSVALASDTALIGLPDDDTPAGTNAGSACIFTRSGSTWTEQPRLTASDAAAGDRFGRSVALSGGSALIGAVGDDASEGSAYVFTGSGATWTQQQKLSAAGGSAGDEFGTSVALSGDTALIGAPKYDSAPPMASVVANTGAAYVFTRSASTWTEQTTLTDPAGAQDDEFGTSVALSGDTALIGAPLDDTTPGIDAGSAHVFTGSGAAWSPQATLSANDGTAGDEFGISVAVSGDTALIGSHNADGAKGGAYVFTRSAGTWNAVPQAKLTAADGTVGDRFGTSVALDGDTALVGALLQDGAKGNAFVFTRSGAAWSQRAKIAASDAAAGDEFGTSVALSGDTVLIGAPKDDSSEGGDYVFRLTNVAPEITVLGNSTSITSGDPTPSVDDHTDFGTVSAPIARTFTIRNDGDYDLALIGGSPLVSLSGSDAFTVTAQPASATIAPSGTQTFEITFDPGTTVGDQTATVSIANDDGDESPFTFTIQGSRDVPLPAKLEARPKSLNFKELKPGRGSKGLFTVTNTGGTAATNVKAQASKSKGFTVEILGLPVATKIEPQAARKVRVTVKPEKNAPKKLRSSIMIFADGIRELNVPLKGKVRQKSRSKTRA